MTAQTSVDLNIPKDAASRVATSRKPRVGVDMVLYRQDINGAEEHPAVVTRVFDPMIEGAGYVLNLSIIPDGGSVVARGQVRFDPGADDRAPKAGTWRWPARG